jgi:hypothetical protein
MEIGYGSGRTDWQSLVSIEETKTGDVAAAFLRSRNFYRMSHLS